MARTPCTASAFTATTVALSLAAMCALLLLTPTPAVAFNENQPFAGGGCEGNCHSLSAPRINEQNCDGCHTFAPDGTNNPGYPNGTPDFPFKGEFAQRGPHGIYTSSTRRCPMCHTLHDAPTANAMLPGATVKATCFTCHDGTQGYGVYGTIQARTGSPAPGGHGIETTNVVPGGDAATGGSATTIVFRGSGNLTCSDCHSPHGRNTVQAFTGERIRVRSIMRPVYSSKLLKKQPTGAPSPVDYYGSDWCAGCHQGRTSSGAAHRHPVETRATRPLDYYYYSRLALYEVPSVLWYSWQNGTPAALTNTNARIGAVGNLHVYFDPRHPIPRTSVLHEVRHENSPWLMAYPRSPLHAGHAPICQQCHEDTRECGELSADGTTVTVVSEGVYGLDADGLPQSWTKITNPRFQNFPHETENANMLVETGDNLCLNCHPSGVLP